MIPYHRFHNLDIVLFWGLVVLLLLLWRIDDYHYQPQPQATSSFFISTRTATNSTDTEANVSSRLGVVSSQRQPPSPSSPSIAWLMSIGGSGTSFTIANVEALTGTTTATNYAEGLSQCIRLDSSSQSPCLHKSLPIPSTFLLTKTHCAGYCMDCMPSAYVQTVDSFQMACRTAKRPSQNNTTTQHFVYDASLVRRAVHLIRNPFDNLVGRMHLGRKRRQQQNRPYQDFQDTPQGLEAWCQTLDDHARDREQKSPLIPRQFVDKYSHVPCHAEWFRFAQWHSLAVQVTDQLHLPVHYLYYENYTTHYKETTEELLDFLELQAINPPCPFHAGKAYHHLFRPDHVQMAALLVQDMASPRAWQLLQHYFEPPPEQLPHSSGRDPTPANAANDDTTTSNFPSLALLMSFPNSGTSYTITNTEHISQRSTASNYGMDLTVSNQLPDGPYIHRPSLPLPSKFMLTKTHCTGYSDSVLPHYHHNNVSLLWEDAIQDFWYGCRTGERRRMNNHNTSVVERPTYNTSLVARVIHLFRDPFDNIVARMHLGVKKRRHSSENNLWAQLDDSPQGLATWCHYMDEKGHVYLQQANLDQETKKRMIQVPCFLEFFRWVQWHNLALAATQLHKDVPVQYLYYEKYTTVYNTTVQTLLEFLELPAVQEPLPFYTGKTYRNFYSEQTVSAAKDLVQTLASPQCWELIQHYFV